MSNRRTGTLESAAEAVAFDPMFAKGSDDQPITREQVCECGRRFTQRLLSERFMTVVETRSKRAAKMVLEQIPGLFVPVHCPPCERRDLGRWSRVADARHESEQRQPEFEHAAD